jgi:peptidoglycan/xylan/chitin deacetylase (PgdA/CDA1 family)
MADNSRAASSSSRSMNRDPLRIVFLTGADTRSTRLSIEAVCREARVQPVAVLLDNSRDSFSRRAKNLRRNVAREGIGYAVSRFFKAVRAASDEFAFRAIVSRREIAALLRESFPERCFTLEDTAARYGFSVHRVGNLNGPEAIAALHECRADLAVVLGTRILRPEVFSVPRLGSINLHKGKVPQYRGMPPGFWELYEGERTAGITVHFVSTKLDAGDVVETAEVEISPLETPESLLEKLDQEGARTLAEAVCKLQEGVAERIPQPPVTGAARTRPTRKEIAALRERLPHWRVSRSDFFVVLKNALYISLYFCLYRVVRARRKRSRAAILLYHRVNDFSQDVLTVGTEMFAAHLLAIRKHYPVISSEELTRCIQNKDVIGPTSVLIHFDDAYRDVYTSGGAILRAAGLPAAAFVSSGFVDTDRAFEHDLEKYPFQYENFRRADLESWVREGFEIGAHTVNHVNLGTCSLEETRFEIVESGAQLERIVGQPVKLFSFPFGKIKDIRPEATAFIREAGYSALFSAYGGFVSDDTSLWDIPRIGVSEEHLPLYLLLEIEGLTGPALSAKFRRLLGRPKN